MTHEEFLNILQKRIASGAVTPSAARRMGPPGTVRAAREFLGKVPLKDVGASGQHYPELLDRLTAKLISSLPEKAKHWGAARKFLNIFLRDATYNIYLREAYHLDKIEKLLEVPVDSHVAEELHNRGHKLPRWVAVKSLNAETNAKYQAAARLSAKAEGIDPVHFDVIAWRKRSDYL